MTTVPCPACNGNGRDEDDAAVSCPICLGRREVFLYERWSARSAGVMVCVEVVGHRPADTGEVLEDGHFRECSGLLQAAVRALRVAA